MAASTRRIAPNSADHRKTSPKPVKASELAGADGTAWGADVGGEVLVTALAPVVEVTLGAAVPFGAAVVGVVGVVGVIGVGALKLTVTAIESMWPLLSPVATMVWVPASVPAGTATVLLTLPMASAVAVPRSMRTLKKEKSTVSPGVNPDPVTVRVDPGVTAEVPALDCRGAGTVEETAAL